ncbi:MAG: barstar family protein [Lachnospiraceae bacterium]|nr:barstar family protein [Lachnospiraceae bacterium]
MKETQTFVIDMNGVYSADDFQGLLEEILPLPDYYGENLDALYDVLTEQGKGWHLIFRNYTEAQVCMEKYMKNLRKMCRRAQENCEGLTIDFED